MAPPAATDDADDDDGDVPFGKVLVTGSDGSDGWGFFDPEIYTSARTFAGRPRDQFYEALYDLNNKQRDVSANPGKLKEPRWLLYKRSFHPRVTGSRECDSLVDHTSMAQLMTPEYALRWFDGQDFPPPADLVALVKKDDDKRLPPKPDAEDPAQDTKLHPKWGVLKGRAATKEQFMALFGLGSRSLTDAGARQKRSIWSRRVRERLAPTHRGERPGRPNYFAVPSLLQLFEEACWPLHNVPSKARVDAGTVEIGATLAGYTRSGRR